MSQEAVARGFEIELDRLNTEESYFKSLAKELESKRNYVVKFLTDVGMKPVVPEGGYFVVADWSNLGSYISLKPAFFHNFNDVLVLIYRALC